MSCSYCGRTKQTGKHQTCDGCGADKPRVYGSYLGREITDPQEFRDLAVKFWAPQMVRPEYCIRVLGA